MQMNRFVIDTDAGVDDAQSILMAFGHPDTRIEAFTTVNGNVGVDKTTANVLKVLDLAGEDVPVYPGCAQPLVNEPHHATYVHGKDGLGDCGIPASKRKAEKKHAVQALIDLGKENPGELGLIAIGPLTNIAAALLIDPELPRKFKDLTIMGGAIMSKGNTNITSEFNIYTDPEAAHIVFTRWPMTKVLSWETTLAHVFTKENLESFYALNTSKSKFFHDTNKIIVDFIKNSLNAEMLFAPDALAVAAAIEPGIITKHEKHHLTVELCGKHTRGQTSVDWLDMGDIPANADLIMEVNQDRFVQLMESGLR
jgi:purine nucleosidase